MGEFVHLEEAAPGVATIRIDRRKANAFNFQILDELVESAQSIAEDADVRAVVVWGGPITFSAGADISGFTGMDVAGGKALARRFNDTFLAIENLPQITVSAVNGYALGGGMELAMATDFRVAADDATFGQPEILLGIIPGGGGTQRLPRLVGITKAKELIYTGRTITAAEALEIGLVSAVHPAMDTYDSAVELAAKYAAGPAALRMAKQAIMDGLALSLDEAVGCEVEQFGECFATEDTRVGVAHFLDKSPGKAAFTGH